MPIIRVMHTFMYDYDYQVESVPEEWDKWNGSERWLWTFAHGEKIWESNSKRYVWAEVPAISEWQMTGDPEALTKSEDK